MTSRLVVFGGSGQVGRALVEATSKSCEVIGLTRAAADISDAATVVDAIRHHAPTCVVNAAAYTNVDKAEKESHRAFSVNRDGARIVAEAVAAARIPLIHLSTDYVFDGRSRVPYIEVDRTAPLGVYGKSKEAGERAVKGSAPKHVILRTSWVYSPFGTNFVRTMLRLGAERSELQVIDDQTGCPTAGADIAAAILAIVKKTETEHFQDWGTYHFAGADPLTWYGFAQLIFEVAATFDTKIPTLKPIATAEYPASARRPAYSVLAVKKFSRTFGTEPAPLRESLVRCLRDLVGGSA